MSSEVWVWMSETLFAPGGSGCPKAESCPSLDLLRDHLLEDHVRAVQIHVGAVLMVDFCHHRGTRHRTLRNFLTGEWVTKDWSCLLDSLLGDRLALIDFLNRLVRPRTPRHDNCAEHSYCNQFSYDTKLHLL